MLFTACKFVINKTDVATKQALWPLLLLLLMMMMIVYPTTHKFILFFIAAQRGICYDNVCPFVYLSNS